MAGVKSTAFCFRIYRAGRRLSCFKMPSNLFWIIPFVDSTSCITQTAFSWHILVSSSFMSVYLWRFSMMVLQRLWLLGIVTFINMFLWWLFKHNYIWFVVVNSSISCYKHNIAYFKSSLTQIVANIYNFLTVLRQPLSGLDRLDLRSLDHKQLETNTL
jgi:hypothetical protein